MVNPPAVPVDFKMAGAFGRRVAAAKLDELGLLMDESEFLSGAAAGCIGSELCEYVALQDIKGKAGSMRCESA